MEGGTLPNLNLLEIFPWTSEGGQIKPPQAAEAASPPAIETGNEQ
jgi:hypothetical protein